MERFFELAALALLGMSMAVVVVIHLIYYLAILTLPVLGVIFLWRLVF